MPKAAAYNMKQIVDEITEKYLLDDTPSMREVIRKKIASICKRIDIGEGSKLMNLWAKTAVTKEGDKKPEHIFTEGEKQRVYDTLEFKAYLSKLCTNDVQKKKLEEEVENERQAELANQREREFWGNFDQNEYDNYYCPISQEELTKKKLEIMIEAVFLKFFTPIDDDLLRGDMEAKTMIGQTDYSSDMMASLKRLEKHAYYKERNPSRDM